MNRVIYLTDSVSDPMSSVWNLTKCLKLNVRVGDEKLPLVDLPLLLPYPSCFDIPFRRNLQLDFKLSTYTYHNYARLIRIPYFRFPSELLLHGKDTIRQCVD